LEDLQQERAQLGALAERVLDEARAQGASAAEAALASSSGLSVTVRLGEVETLEHDRGKGLGITVYFGQQQGSASTSDFSTEALRRTVEAACRIARHTAPDPCNGLADASLMAHHIPDLDLYHPWELGAEQAIELARECEDAARGLDERITNSEGATVSRHEASRVYGNTHGFLGSRSGTRHSVSCAVIAQNGDGMQQDYWYTASRDPATLEGPAAVGRHAAERALDRLGARQLATRSAPVLFAAEVAGGLFGHFVGAIRGSSLYRKSTFLLDHLGRPVFPAGFHIAEQPHLRGAAGSAPFDNEGVATRERDLIRDGVLQGYALDSYSARRLGMQTTGNAGGVHNLVVAHGDEDRAGLLRQMGSGLLVTSLMGMGVNAVTGDYSRGATGFWVEGGELAYPVQEITIAGNLRDMFMGIRAVGNDVDERGNIRTGSVLVEQMTVAGA
jgi:PmbA protein